MMGSPLPSGLIYSLAPSWCPALPALRITPLNSLLSLQGLLGSYSWCAVATGLLEWLCLPETTGKEGEQVGQASPTDAE